MLQLMTAGYESIVSPKQNKTKPEGHQNHVCFKLYYFRMSCILP